MMGVFFNSGQVCCAGTRIFVQKERYDEVSMIRSANFSKGVTMGDPLRPEEHRSDRWSRKEQFDSVKGYLELGKKEGATVRPVATAGCRQGLLRQADALLRRQQRHADRARGDFWPGRHATISFTDENDAVFQGNNTEYGLSAAVWTRDISRAHKVARALKAGTVWVNCYISTRSDLAIWRLQAVGFRPRTRQIRDRALYTQIKSVYIKL